jgi:cardiolipin synthase C
VQKILVISILSGLMIFSCTSSYKNQTTFQSNVPFYDREPASESLQKLFMDTEEGVGVESVVHEINGYIPDKNKKCGNIFQCLVQRRAKALTGDDVMKASSSFQLTAKKAELITDNDKSFYTKLNAIRNAKKSIRMVYYIYSNDDSSSVISRELIKKAQAGVKVKLLVDFITNYKMMDLFQYMAKAGNGNIDIRFYNFPTERILRDAVYMTTPCPKQSDNPSSKECMNHKKNLIGSTNSTYFSKMFLTGLYGKSAGALKLSLGLGGKLDPADFKPQVGDEPTDPEAIKAFFGLLKDAIIDNNLGAKIKLQFAMIFMAGQVNPVLDKLTGVLPIIDTSKSDVGISHAEEWDHFSDYVHHKLLAVDERVFQLGGRNIEDSYHMKQRLQGQGRVASGKYIFKDTDFYVETLDTGARQIEIAFDKMFNFNQMVASMGKVNQYLDFDLIANADQNGYAATNCAKSGTSDIERCIKQGKTQFPGYASVEARLAKVASDMIGNASAYLQAYPGMSSSNSESRTLFKSEFNELLTGRDLETAQLFYLENLSFDKDAKVPVRHVGSKFRKDLKYEKNIHLMWYKELENACYISKNENRDVRVIFHNAYLILPSGIMYTLGKMMNGGFGDCSKVHVTFLTNSFNTSDLNVINILARYQMAMVFKYQEGLKRKQYQAWSPKIDMYEYFSEKMGAGFSLHSKLALFDNDIIVGSANLDVRSYYMDTNNAMLIRNAPNLANEYRNYVEAMLRDSRQTTRIDTSYVKYSSAQIQGEDQAIVQGIIDYFLAKSNAKKRAAGLPESTSYKFATDKRMGDAINTIHEMGTHVSFNAYKLLTDKGRKNYVEMLAESEETNSDTRMKLRKVYDEFNNMFKVL